MYITARGSREGKMTPKTIAIVINSSCPVLPDSLLAVSEIGEAVEFPNSEVTSVVPSNVTSNVLVFGDIVLVVFLT